VPIPHLYDVIVVVFGGLEPPGLGHVLVVEMGVRRKKYFAHQSVQPWRESVISILSPTMSLFCTRTRDFSGQSFESSTSSRSSDRKMLFQPKSDRYPARIESCLLRPSEYDGFGVIGCPFR